MKLRDLKLKYDKIACSKSVMDSGGYKRIDEFIVAKTTESFDETV